MPGESGYSPLGLEALSGMHDYSGSGRSVVNKTVSVATTDTVVLDNNLSRHWALLINDGDNDIYIRLGEAAALNTGILLNANGGWCLINKDMPWTGVIHAIAATAATILLVTEVSLQHISSEPETPGTNGGSMPKPLWKC